MTKYVTCSEFVKRQTPESGYSHFNGTWEELEDLVHTQMCRQENVRRGYKPGVLLVDVPAWNFSSAIVDLDSSSKLNANYLPRLLGEAPYIRISAKAEKQQAAYASVVLYHKTILEEDNDRSSESEWEIVAIKARTSKNEEPMDPYTMARNFLHLKGGTKGDFTAQQFAESIVYWNNHCMASGKPKWYRKLLKFIRGY